MKKNKLQMWAGAGVMLLISISAANAKPALFEIPQISTFDGASWGNFKLGESTRGDISKKIRLSKSGRFDNSFKVITEKKSPVELDMLFATRRDVNAQLRGFVYRNNNNALAETTLSTAIEGPGEVLYPRERFENWYVTIYPRRGIAAFVINGYAPLIVLMDPSALSNLRQNLTTSKTPVTQRVDPHANEPRIMYFGTVGVSDNLKGGLSIDESNKKDSESALKSATAGGTMRYRSGASGSYTISVTGSGSVAEGGIITVTATIRGESPYGPISGSGMSSKSWAKPANIQQFYSLNLDSLYTQAMVMAKIEAERDFAATMRSVGPPPLAVVREGEWQKILGQLIH